MSVTRDSQELSLCLRATFIDIDPIAASVQRLARARSEEPRARGGLVEDAGLEGERRYVQQLSGLLAAIGSPAAARLHFGGPRQPEGKALKTDMASLATTALPDDEGLSALSFDSGLDGGLGELPAVPVPMPSSSRRTRRPLGLAPAAGRSNTSLAMMLMQGKAAPEPETAPQRPPGSFDTGSKLSWADETELPEAAEVPATFGCSAGSAGHPDLCNRPCMYVTSFAGCEAGELCEYCHMEHPKRAPHLDKRHREMLRAMSAAEWACVIIPILVKKVEAVDNTGKGLGLVTRLCRQAQLPEGLECSAPQRHQRMMVLTLRAMTLKTLIATIQRSLPGCDEAGVELCRELTAHLLAEVLKR